MFKRKINKILLVIVGVLVVCGGFAQDPTAPTDNYADLGSINTPVSSDDPVCPSLDENADGNIEESSTSVFRLPVFNPATPEIGLPGDNSFEWVVFGGWITEINSSAINEASYSHSRLRTTTGNIRYSYLTADGVSNPGDPQEDWEVFITVQWDTTNFSTQNGWVAVRHLSEWSCTDGGWSVFENTIENNPPQFDADFPADITMPYDLRNNYSLPLPGVTDEGCNRTPFLTFTVTLPDATEISGDETDTEVDLQVGDNVVTWTADDGSKTVSRSYTITVEPSLDILNIAWLNPTCDGSTDGSLLVTNTTEYAFVNSIEYSLNSAVDADFDTNNHFENLGAGTYTIRGRMVYNVDTDNDGTPEEYIQPANDNYTATLISNAATAVDDVPPEGPNVDIDDAGCLNKNDGSIEVTEGVMQPQNHSVTFDGDDYLVTNKSYTSSLSQFSVAAWVKIPSTGDVGGTIISFDNEEFYELSVIYYSTTSRALIRFYTNPEDGVFRHTTIVNDDEWHLVVATYDNGDRAIYIDGVKIEQSSASPQSVGQGGNTRFGIIGAGSETDVFADTPSSPFFKGQMAEVGIWDNYVLTDADVTNIMKGGMVGTTDHWLFNNTPAEISASYDYVYTDLGNSTTTSNWARFYNGVRTDNDSPLLLSWTDDLGGTVDDDYLPVYTLENLGVGNYTLHVKDVLGCGEDTENYNVENSDALPPELYWNVAINKEAEQLSTNGSNFASLAVDGLGAVSPSASQTNNDNEVWWEVDLGKLYSVREILIHPASDFADFYVMTSPNTFGTASNLSDDLARGDVNSYEHVGSTSGETRIRVPGSARYVRIRTSGNASLHLAEVEVFAAVSSPVRELYLRSGECFYEILDDEYGIVPMVYDACDGVNNFENDRTNTDNLIGEQLTHNPADEENFTDYTVTWTADDDAGLDSDPLNVTYRVIDNEPPVMDPLPFANAEDTITYCESQSYSLLLPKITDNFPLTCDDLNYIELYSDNYMAYEKTPVSDYDPSVDEYTGNLDYGEFLSAGDHDLIWKVEDHSGSLATDTLFLHVEIQPQVVDVKTSPITCSGNDNAIVIFADITSEQDINTAVEVEYVLQNTNTFAEIRQTNNPQFNNVPVGTYSAFIEVNSCPSAVFYNTIEITDPDPVAVTPDITPVECSGWSDGAIELLTNGGSETDVLHLWGEDNTGASAGNYNAVDLTSVGSVEAWVYIDTLGGAVGETNYNTGLFGAENSYGFTIVDGQLVFFAGAEQAGPVAIADEQWVHLAGTWSAADQAMTLYVDGIQQATNTIDAAFAAPVDGDLFMGYLPGGNADNGLQGFVRNFRVWNKQLTPAEISSNYYLLDPIDPGANLVANLPVAAGGGTSLQNRVALPGATAGNVNTPDYTWQKFAYRWENSSGDFVARTRDVFNQVADDYTVQMQDPQGCVHSETFTININDTDKPTLTFFSDGYGNTELTVGEPIVRYTDDTNTDLLNVSGDCMYYPAGLEFDPEVDDGLCPEGDVTLSFQVLSGDYAPANPPAVDASSLDGVSMTDEIRLEWTAEDQAGNTRTAEVNYYIIDNEGPVLTWGDQVRDTDLGHCYYTVTEADSLLGLSYADNCETGRLYNNINGTQSLEGETFAPGDYSIRWIYEDKTFPGGYFVAQAETITHTLTVIDDQPPTLVCNAPFSVDLDAGGAYTLSNLDVVDSWGDNCSEATAVLHVTKNIAYSAGTATMSSYQNGACYTVDADNANAALDGNTSSAAAGCSSALTTAEANPYWQVGLGAAHTLYGVNLFESDAAVLENFWVLVSDDGTFENTGDWTGAGAVFGNDVIYAEYFNSTVSGEQLFTFPAAVENATHVQIRMNTASAQLALAEVEVYGTTDPVNATELDLGCDDVRYTPGPNPVVQDGTFNPIGVLLSAIDNDGNITSCLTDVTVVDLTSPIVVATGNVKFYLDENGEVNINDPVEIEDRLDNGSNDACSIDSFWVSPDQFTCLNLGPRTVDLHARDVNGNVASQSVNIAISDTLKPNMNIQNNISFELGDDGTYTIDPLTDIDDGTSYDNCTGYASLIFSTTPEIVDCDDIGTSVPIVYSIRDLQGNDTTRTVYVEVADVDGPTAVLNDFELIIQPDNSGVIEFSDIIEDASLRDNCTTDFTGRKFISYNVSGNWCPAGSEGTAASSAFTNIAPTASVTASTHYDTYIDDYVNDGENTATAYITNSTSGERQVELTFSEAKEFDRAIIEWEVRNLTNVQEISRNYTLLPDAAISSNVGTRSGDYALTQCRDGSIDYRDEWNSVRGPDYTVREEVNVTYHFSSTVIITSTEIRWDVDNPSSWYDPYIEYSMDGTTWTSLGTVSNNSHTWLEPSSSPFSPVEANYIRVVCDRWQDERVGIDEWRVFGYQAPREYNSELPSSATLQYYDGGWQDVNGTSDNVGLTSGQNELVFDTYIQTDRFRLLINGDDQRVGVENIWLYGRDISAGNACIDFSCSDVGTEIPVFLLIEDEQGISTEYSTTVPVLPYFDIVEIQLKDCGYDGERYYPTIADLSSSLDYDYIWSEVDDIDYGGGSEDLFEYSDDTGNADDKIPNGDFPYTMPVPDRDWINLGTGSTYRFPDDGRYTINLTLMDENACYDSYDYTFDYESSNTTATSIKPWESCVGDIDTFMILFPETYSFWAESYNIFEWVDLGTQPINILSGGNNGDSFVEVEYLGGDADIQYRYQSRKFIGNVTSDILTNTTGSAQRIDGYTLVVTDSLTTGGPYWTEDNADWRQWIQPGETYVECDDNDWWGDYGNCMESVLYDVTVYDVPEPSFESYDATICLLDTITYTVDPTQQTVFDHYSWSWTHGRQYAGGNADDPYITIIWDDYEDLSYYPGEKPSVTVKGYNQLNCSDSTTIEMDYSGSTPPVLDCSGKDLVQGNTPGACTYTFQNIGPPVMTDDCNDRIESYYNDYTSGTNAAGEYPLGTTTVTWYAYDYNGNEGTCNHTITVLDTEPPSFGAPPASNKRELSANTGCDHLYSGTDLDMTASDICNEPVTLTATVYRANDPDGIYDDVEASGLTTLDGYTFLQGDSRVEWTATDDADNSAYVADGYDAFNTVTTEYYVTVTDDTAPVIDPLAAISGPNDAGVCSATLTIAPPDTDVISDNCSADGNLTVEFISRDDGDDINDPYPVGTTTITWMVSDEATPPNRTTATQTVTVNDTQEPWYDDAGFALQDTSIGYCTRDAHRLPIPTPYDNCGVESITWQIVNNGGTAYSETGTITRASSPNFNPNGNGLTNIIPALPADNVNGSDYTVTWSLTDAATPANTNSTVYSYTIHVEIEPYYNLLDAIPMSCGNANDGQIAVTTSSEYRVEPGYDVYYTIDNWENEQTNPIFTGLSGGTYNIQMRVNGCFSGTRQATIIQPEVYDMSLSETNPYCYEAVDGEIDLTMTGGVDGQVLFTGGAGLTAGHYAELDLTSTGSIEGWVYLESYDDATLVAKGTDYSLQLLGSKFTIDVNGTHLGDGAAEGAGIIPELQRWYYVAATWDTGAGEMQLFVSGANQGGSIQGTLNNAPTNSSNVTIGNGLDGIIREARIWDNVVDGSVPSSKYTGSEANLVAFWPMDDGSGASAENSCNNKNTNATNAGGASGLWAVNQPQPGTYTWTKDGAFYSNDIDLTGLGRGVYEVAFQDPYDCPAAPGLVRSVTIIPQDNEQPNISTTSNTTLDVDPGDACQRVITAQDFTDYPGLLPTVTDACNFDLTWRVIPAKTLIPQSFVGNNYEGAILEIGDNRVEVTASQYNGNVTATAFFNVIVEDIYPPVADGENVTNVELSNDYNPMGSGIVYYSAIGFNQNSSDNCTPRANLEYSIRRNATDPWSEEILFDCDDVGEVVQIFFRATDEAELTAEESGNTMTVVDTHNPVFLNDGTIYEYEECATVDAGESTGEPAYMVVPAGNLKLNEGLYSDNCGISNIQYSLDHEGDAWGDMGWTDGDDPSADGLKFYEGVTHVYFKIFDNSSNEAETQIYKVTTLPKPEPGGGIY